MSSKNTDKKNKNNKPKEKAKKVDPLEKLDFKLSNTKFRDGRKMVESRVKGDFTIDQIKARAEKEAKKLRDDKRDAMIGVAMHYKNMGWVASKIQSIEQPVGVYLPMSADADMFEGDQIDAVDFYVINAKTTDKKELFHTPKKDGRNIVNTRIFKTKKD